MKRTTMMAMALLATATIAQASTTVDKPVLLATGDSYTRQTGCNGGYDYCDSTGQIPHERGYSTYLNAITQYQVALSDNSARGGETCTTQADHVGGIYDGEDRGLLAAAYDRIVVRDADMVSILIGINDVNLFGVSQATLEACLEDLYDVVTDGGQKVVAMTYPGVSTSTTVWPGISGATASANVATVNDAIRNAVDAHNLAFPSRPVILAETSTAWTAGTASSYTVDGAHPSATGAMRLAREWFDEVCTGTYPSCL